MLEKLQPIKKIIATTAFIIYLKSFHLTISLKEIKFKK